MPRGPFRIHSVHGDGDGDSCNMYTDSNACDVAGCLSIFLIEMYPSTSGDADWCVGDALEFKGCITDPGCGDAPTIFCDSEDTYWWSSDTCGPADMEACSLPGTYEFC